MVRRGEAEGRAVGSDWTVKAIIAIQATSPRFSDLNLKSIALRVLFLDHNVYFALWGFDR
jgi:hypothetical protein